MSHLPVTKTRYGSISTYVDRFSKRVHVVPSKTSGTPKDVANQLFWDIFRLHGIPDSIVFDRNLKFTAKI